MCLAVNSELPIHNIAELIAYAKANPGKLNFGASIGTPPHISGEMFNVLTGTKIIFIPYKTAAAAASDVVAGQIQVTFQGTTGIMPFVKTGKLRPIGVVSPQRIPEFSDVPTMAEQGVKGMPPDAWQGIVAPAGTPADIIAKLNHVINEGLSSPETEGRHYQAGRQPKADHSGRIRVLHYNDEAGMGEGDQSNRREDQVNSHLERCRRGRALVGLKQYGFRSNCHRHCEERSDEATQECDAALDCFASLAMTTKRLDLKSSRYKPV